MWFSRRRFKLPKFPAEVAPAFRQLCEAISPEEAQKLKTLVTDRLGELEAEAKSRPMLDLATASVVADRCVLMLDQYPSLNSKQRAEVIGAARYFAVADDPLPESTFTSGFDDDARVVNYVLESIGMDDKFIDVGGLESAPLRTARI